MSDRSLHKEKPEEKYLPECLKKTVKHPTKVMIWSVISAKGIGTLYVVDGNMNQHQYKQVLQSRLLPQIRDWYPRCDCTFMHDGAPCHQAKSIKKYLVVQGIKVLDWPGNSPDLNPIEGIWNDMKNSVSEIVCTTKAQLIESIIQVRHPNPRIEELAKKYIA